MRVGTGYDAHRLVEGRPLILGGVRIESSHGLEGHSDADVLVHAIVDAILGAAALGDIGEHFPSNDDRWRDASSLVFLEAAAGMARAFGLVVASVDATVLMEGPRLRPHREQMRRTIAEALGVDVDVVSVKATTTDGLGFIGRQEGIAAHAVVGLAQAP